jgi:general secretion pathway protein M
MKAWWYGLSPRDRTTALVGAIAVAAMLAWGLVWEPLAAARRSLAQQVVQAEADYAWLQGAAVEVQRARNSGTATPLDRAGRSLLALADATARDAGLGLALKRVEPVSAGRVNTWFEAASFDVLATWIEQLGSGYGIVVEELSVDRGAALGTVDARVTLVDVPAGSSGSRDGSGRDVSVR